MAATYTKPTTLPRWADDEINNLEPSEGKKDEGWVFEEAPASNYENWRAQLTGQWFKWLDERLDDGADENTLIINDPNDGGIGVKIGSNVVRFVDDDFSVTITASNPTITFDTNDYMQYDRAGNTLTFTMGSVASVQLGVSGSDAALTFDTADYITYNRTSNYYSFLVASTEEAKIDASGLQITNGLVVGYAAAPTNDQIRLGDAELLLSWGAGTIPELIFANTGGTSYDCIRFVRASDTFEFVVANNVEASLDSTGLLVADRVKLGDGNFGMVYDATVPALLFETGGGFSYDRSINELSVVINSAVEMTVVAEGVYITNNAYIADRIVGGGFAGSLVSTDGAFETECQDVVFVAHDADIAHGVTTTMRATDVWASLEQVGSSGGAFLLGATESISAVVVQGISTNEDTTTATTAEGAVTLVGCKSNGASTQAVGNTANAVVFSNSSSAKMILKGNGDLYVDGTGSSNTYDHLQDAVACHDAMYAFANESKKIIEYDREKLAKLGIMTETGFINIQKCNALLLGGVGEMYQVLSLLLKTLGLNYETLRQQVRA
jgi:hypothetical protein